MPYVNILYVYVRQIDKDDFQNGLLWTVGQLLVQLYRH